MHQMMSEKHLVGHLQLSALQFELPHDQWPSMGTATQASQEADLANTLFVKAESGLLVTWIVFSVDDEFTLDMRLK